MKGATVRNAVRKPQLLPGEALDGVAEVPPSSPRRRAGERPRLDLFEVAWRLLTSVRVALLLIIALAVASLVGVLLIQVPGELSGATEYAQWLERIRPKYGLFTDVLSALGLFDVFSSLWFRAALGLLSLSIVVCSLNRWPGVNHSLTEPRVHTAPGFFRATVFRAEIPVAKGNLHTAAAAVATALHKKGYRVLQEQEGTTIHYFADRNRYSQLGTFALHLGLVLILAGALLGSVTSRREPAFVIPEGSVRAVGFGTDLAVKLESFADEYYPDGPPKDYRSELVLYRGATEVSRKTIRVNDPLEYEGWRFHQAFFGPAVDLEVRDDSGRSLFDDSVALAWRTAGDRAMGSFRLPADNLTVYLVAPAPGGVDPVIKAGELRLEMYRGADSRPVMMENIQQGQPKTVEGMTFIFQRERQFSGLQVVKDPAAPLVYIAWALVALGLIAVCYFPYRRLWARCQQEADGALRVYLGATGRRDLGLAREFAAVEHAVRAQLRPTERRSSHG